MKKIIILLVAVLTFSSANSQKLDPQSFVGLGLSVIEGESVFSMDFAVDGYYMGFASNYAVGDGIELNYSTGSTYATDLSKVSVLNFGYFIPLSEEIMVAPILGYGWSSPIYQDPLGFDTYFYGASEGAVNLGVKATYIINETVGFMVGLGTFENFQACLLVRI
tara:strand:+ start:750 stop:1241 length:492 start_codon:yes stop_codon:yes gene_type:complete